MENRLPFQMFALHRGGENDKAKAIIAGKAADGNDWKLDFAWSTPAFEKQFGGVKGLPSYYFIDKTGRMRAVLKGHSKDMLETIVWMTKQVEARSQTENAETLKR